MYIIEEEEEKEVDDAIGHTYLDWRLGPSWSSHIPIIPR